MNDNYICIGDHTLEISSKSAIVNKFLSENFEPIFESIDYSNIKIEIIETYGTPFIDYNVYITKENGKTIFRRSDYLIEAETDYSSATIFINNELALKHALMNLYSSYIVYHNWGLLIHSSCVIENEKAHIFAGHSGAGKSTAARLSHPRELLSDEATLVKITSDEILVYNSPFRSDITSNEYMDPTPLASIQILHQSLQNKRVNMKKSDAYIHLMDKVFYWAHDPNETKNIMELLRTLVDRVPNFELYFKKDDTFWELIS
ncbi:hypothetical protein [Neobacillus sp. D3-1R]|uniref:hypothetical protein n=1 Tax=Neobacillus sp. D3-1R TaxID=3445778 RepID=UPI003FA15DA9